VLRFVPRLEDADEFWEWFVACAYVHHVDVEDVRPVGEPYVDLVALWRRLQGVISYRANMMIRSSGRLGNPGKAGLRMLWYTGDLARGAECAAMSLEEFAFPTTRSLYNSKM